MQKHNESGSNVDHVKKKPEKELTDTEKRMQEVRNRLHKKKSNDSISMVSTPGTMSISRADFLEKHTQSKNESKDETAQNARKTAPVAFRVI